MFGETSFAELVELHRHSIDIKALVNGAVAFWLHQMPVNIPEISFKGTEEQVTFLQCHIQGKVTLVLSYDFGLIILGTDLIQSTTSITCEIAPNGCQWWLTKTQQRPYLVAKVLVSDGEDEEDEYCVFIKELSDDNFDKFVSYCLPKMKDLAVLEQSSLRDAFKADASGGVWSWKSDDHVV